MLHHVSFAVRDPHHVAKVVAELWRGKITPFPGHSGSFIALAMDAYGTAIEFLPKGSVLKPAASGERYFSLWQGTCAQAWRSPGLGIGHYQ